MPHLAALHAAYGNGAVARAFAPRRAIETAPVSKRPSPAPAPAPPVRQAPASIPAAQPAVTTPQPPTPAVTPQTPAPGSPSAGAGPTTGTPAAQKGASGTPPAKPASQESAAGTPGKAALAPPGALKQNVKAGTKDGKKDTGDHKAEKDGKDSGASAASAAGLHAVTAQVRAAGHAQRQHGDAGKKADEAKAAVGRSEAESKSQGRQEHIGVMAGQKRGVFDREAFKESLRKKIEQLQADDAKDIKEEDQAEGISKAVKGEVAAGKEAAGGPAVQTAKLPPPDGPGATEGAKLPAADPGAPPHVDGSRAAPAPVSQEQVSVTAESKALDHQMAAAHVTTQQLHKSNEPAFQAAAAATDVAHAKAEALPAQARAREQGILAKAKGSAAALTQGGLAGMHGQRAESLAASRAQQTDAKTQHEEARVKVAGILNGVYDDTKKAVDARLIQLDKDVADTFDDGAKSAKFDFYVFLGEKLLVYYVTGGWLVNLFTGGDTKDSIFKDGRDEYIAAMDEVIDRVATVVETGLKEVVGLIADGKTRLDTEFAKLDPREQVIGREVLQGIQTKFADLEKSVEEKQNQIIDSLAQKYVQAQKEVDAVIAVLKDPVGAIIQAAVDLIDSVIETIRKIRDLLLGVLAKMSEAIDLILDDPIGFLGNLVEGVKQGLLNFVANIGTHLQKGLMTWLFGTLAKAGIQMPEKFDLAGILKLVLQILGLTYANFRKRAVAIVGEKIVKALETASEIVIAFVTKGVAGLWEYIKDKTSQLLQAVLDGIKSFLIEKVIMAGVTWLIGLLNPASAFLKACKAIYDVIMFFIQHGQEILDLVNAVLDSILAIAKGNVGVAAKAVEKALANAVPVAIGFLAGLLGLGGLSEKIKEIIEKIQEPINAVIDWLINKAVALVKAIGKMLGFGKEEKKEDEKDLGDAKNAARAAVHQRIGEHTTIEQVEEVLSQILQELQPSGLKSLSLGPANADGQREILAEASPKDRVGLLVAKEVIVAVAVKISIGKEDTQPALKGILQPPMQTSVGPLGESLGFSDMPGLAGQKWGGTGKAAQLPNVPQPPGTPAKAGGQPSAALLIEPKAGSQEIEILAWNTSAPVKGSNVSHAERQFIEWFGNRPLPWLKRVEKVDIEVEGRPICEKCLTGLEELKKDHPWITFTWGDPKGEPTEGDEADEVELK
jgi:hypothetical protein